MKLSDFKDEKAVEVVAKLLVPIMKIASNKENEKAKDKGGIAFASALLQNNKKDILAIFAILNERNPEEYHCDAAKVLLDTFTLISDPALMALFGLQRQTVASSGSASTTGEATAESTDS